MLHNLLRWLEKILIALCGAGMAGILYFLSGTVLPLGYSPAGEQRADAIETSAPYADLKGYQDILDLQKAFVRNAKKLKPSVVSVNNLRKIHKGASRGSFHRPKTPESWYLQFREWMSDFLEREYVVEGLGSGVILDKQGHILTNYHVVEDANRIHVRLHDNREYNARVVGTDPVTDLAVLKIFAIKNLPVPAFGNAERLNVGEWVMAIGNPYGLDGTVTVGVVSGKSRSDLGIATFENFLQTDASINPGNSGGPLINIEGEIVGINTAVAAIGAGVGFAIPIEMARTVGEELIRKGKVERGWLGVGIQPLTPELARSFNMPELEGGVVVNNVDRETPAIKGGMQRGDIIVQFDGRAIANAKNFQQMVASAPIGRLVPIKIIRDGHEKMLEIKIGKMEH